ncbi:MAG: cation:proton antiporter [Planctomycetota bacterium]
MITLAAGGASQVMLDLLVLLAAAAIVSLLVGRVKIAPIAGYLIAGAVFGPNALGIISDTGSIAAIEQIAIVLLMFGIGLHLDRSDLRAGMLPTLGIGLLSTLLSIGIGTPVAMLFGLPWAAAFAVAAGLAMSSTAVVLRTLQQRRQLRQVHGQIAFGTLITQDLVVVVVLALMPVIAGLAGAGDAPAASVDVPGLLAKGGLTIGLVAALIIAGLTVLPKLIREATRDASSELGLVVSATVGLGAAVLTAWLDLSPELGAFLAGFLLAGTPVRFQLSGQIGPMRDLFMAVFFTAVGLTLDLQAVGSMWWVLLLAITATLTIKAAVIGGSAWVLGASPGSAARAGLNLAQAGEFSLVIFGAAELLGIFGDQAATITSLAIGVVFLSLLLTPGLMAQSPGIADRLAAWPLAPWLAKPLFDDSRDRASGEHAPHAIVAGFGPIGRAVTEKLERRGIPVRVIELNRQTVERQRALGRTIFYGDVTNPDVLDSAGVRDAEAFVLTMPDDDIMLRACRQIRAFNPRVYITARTNYLSRAFQAKELGANHVIVEEIATAEAMVGHVLEACFEAIDPDPDTRTSRDRKPHHGAAESAVEDASTDRTTGDPNRDAQPKDKGAASDAPEPPGEASPASS